jgi:energy-coupling factor transporter ATP-binding protein EcfA2
MDLDLGTGAAGRIRINGLGPDVLSATLPRAFVTLLRPDSTPRPRIRVTVDTGDYVQDFGDLETLDIGEEVVCANPTGRSVYFCDGVACWAAQSHETHVIASPRGGRLRNAAFNSAISRALALAGAPVLHAAAVIYRGRCILMCGDSGSGKSTAAAAVLAAGGIVISDDSVSLFPSRALDSESTRHRWRARSLRDDLYLNSNTLRALGLKSETAGGSLQSRKACIPRDWFRHQSAGTAAVGAFVSLTSGNRAKLHVEPLTSAAVLGALVQSCPFLRDRADAAFAPAFAAAVGLAQALPAARVCLSERLLADPVAELDALTQQIRKSIPPEDAVYTSKNGDANPNQPFAERRRGT